MADVDGSDSSTATSVILEGHLKKQGKFSTKWYHCFAKLEKDCFVYKRNDKVIYNLFLFLFLGQSDRQCLLRCLLRCVAVVVCVARLE